MLTSDKALAIKKSKSKKKRLAALSGGLIGGRTKRAKLGDEQEEGTGSGQRKRKAKVTLNQAKMIYFFKKHVLFFTDFDGIKSLLSHMCTFHLLYSPQYVFLCVG